jgi:DNA-binding NarL/FixJ family response regulator|tara:strand:+ start:6595 stop:7257 length:663 start_codon:yes stop_codon:yes gene_type:complete
MGRNKMPDAPRVLIVDDHPLFRDALETALECAFPSGAEATHASNLSGALDILRSNPVDLILLDLNLGDCAEFEGLTTLLAAEPGCPIVVVSATETPKAFQMAGALGAAGYLPKSMSLEDLSAALATTLDGGTWFPKTNGTHLPASPAAERIASLTPAQRRVLAGLSAGLLNKQIAHEMDISVATVKAHMTAIFRKLGANNRTQALLIYQEDTSVGSASNA